MEFYQEIVDLELPTNVPNTIDIYQNQYFYIKISIKQHHSKGVKDFYVVNYILNLTAINLLEIYKNISAIYVKLSQDAPKGASRFFKNALRTA